MTFQRSNADSKGQMLCLMIIENAHAMGSSRPEQLLWEGQCGEGQNKAEETGSHQVT